MIGDVARHRRAGGVARGVEPVAGIILAGGLSRRMGGDDKALRQLGGKPLIRRVIDRLKPQAAPVGINANGDLRRFAAFWLPVIPDATDDFLGPLAGVLAGMRWAACGAPQARFIVTAACDTPFFPADLVQALFAATSGIYPSVAVAASGGQVHPVFGLWPIALADDLALALRDGTRKVQHWVDRHPHVVVEFHCADAGGKRIDPFFNTNTPDELAEAERMLAVDGA
jgi:molybdenum cofactor guanylyltransferase